MHGLTTDFLRDKPKFATLANDVVEYLRDAELIIHNAAFDVGFLNKELELAGLPPLRSFVGEVTDTLAMAKAVYPGKRNSLDALCDRFGVDRSNRTFHGAKLDAQLLADVYINLTRGQDALLIDVASNEPAHGRGGGGRSAQLRAAGADGDRARTRRARGAAAATRQGQQRPNAFSADRAENSVA